MINSEAVVRTLVGRVTSDKRMATRTVEVEWTRRHERYGKVLRGQSVFQVHDPENESKTGDLIEIRQIPPVSATKSWQLVKVIEKGE
jgi:small subunit ribosomal protein S17